MIQSAESDSSSSENGAERAELIRDLLNRMDLGVDFLVKETGRPLKDIWMVCFGNMRDPTLEQKIAELLKVERESIWTSEFQVVDSKKNQPAIPKLKLTKSEVQQYTGHAQMVDRKSIISKIRAYNEALALWEDEFNAFEKVQVVPFSPGLSNSRSYVTVAFMPDGNRYGLIKRGIKYTLPNGDQLKAYDDAVEWFRDNGGELYRFSRSDVESELKQRNEEVARFFEAYTGFEKEMKKYEAALEDWQKKSEERKTALARTREIHIDVPDDLREFFSCWDDEFNLLRDAFIASISRAPVADEEGWDEIDVESVKKGHLKSSDRLKFIAVLPDNRCFWIVAVAERAYILPNGEMANSMRSAMQAVVTMGGSVSRAPVNCLAPRDLYEIQATGKEAMSKMLTERRLDLTKGIKAIGGGFKPKRPSWAGMVRKHQIEGTWRPSWFDEDLVLGKA